MDRVVAAVAMACAGVTVAASAVAQVPPDVRSVRGTVVRTPRIEAVDVEQVARLAPGVPLVFTVYGSPGAVASLAIDSGARALRDVPMREVDPGVYEATVTVRDGDRLAPDARVVATLRIGDRVAREELREALVLGATTASDEAHAERDAGATRASDDRSDPRDPREVRSASPAGETRRVGRPVPLAAIAVPRPSPAPAPTTGAWPASPDPADARPAAFAFVCTDCATVESIRAIEGDDAPQRAGAFASAVTGTVLGERFGEAHGRRVTKIWNVLSGRRADASGATRWEVVLRDRDGASIVRRYDERPLFAVGESVRLGIGATVVEPRDAAWR